MEFRRVNKSEFIEIIKYLNANQVFIECLDAVYSIYNDVCDSIEDVFKSIVIKKFSPINPAVITLYILNELDFAIKNQKIDLKEAKNRFSDKDFASYIASICADKYLTNEQLNFKSEAFLNKFNPEISTLSLYLNFTLNILNNLQNLDKYQNLLRDLLKNCFSLAKCIESLLVSGFDVEAFSTRRTMHENECIIYCLINNGQKIFDEYFKHIEYSLAYRMQIKDKETNDKIFEEIKRKMKSYELKSKDTKKFIEYGYLFAIPNKKFNEDFKLNFRDGVENLAGLKNYANVYELSSEVAHSSPLLIYSNRQYYFNITMINLYESFFRLENVFHNFYKSFASKEEQQLYLNMHDVYLKQLKIIHKNLSLKFLNQ